MKPLLVYKSGIHLGEERLIEGNLSSGMISFSGCHLACRFCYTPETSVHRLGQEYTPEAFRELIDELVLRGARNLNLISPTHVWPHLKKPLLESKLRYGRLLPIVLKISGYETESMIQQMAAYADVFVPDFKVWSPQLAAEVGVPGTYGVTAQRALAKMITTHGNAHFTSSGKLTHGILLRHLIMPHALDDSLAVIEALREIHFAGFINFMTYFVDPDVKRVVNASPETVEILTTAAESAGMTPLVNGKVDANPSALPLEKEGKVDVGR
jgi:putative pyruvate formate lyase activating enzyme